MLADDITRELPFLRQQAESLMVDEATITRNGGEAVFDPVTGTYTDPADSTIYTGPCRVQVGAPSVTTPEAGGDVLSVLRLTVQVPVSATGIQVNDVVTITAATHDPDLEGKTYRVTGTHAKTHATARRLEVEEVA